MPEIFDTSFPEYAAFQALLTDCCYCPHHCHVNRTVGDTGFCKTGAEFEIAAVVAHLGEEPVISGKNGICNVFFRHCNLKCVFCQNYQISQPNASKNIDALPILEVMQKITDCLDNGCRSLGFVSPSHMIPHVKLIIQLLHKSGRFPVIVYNSNAYDDNEMLKSLEGLVNVYLPDLKYMDTVLSMKYSGIADYPEKAVLALKEMYRQKGSTLIIDDDGTALSGMIIRHLVLPGNTKNSFQVLNFIAEELSPNIHISLMAQYYPVHNASDFQELSEVLTQDEYSAVISEFERIGLHRGWIQELNSHGHYRPDFNLDNPF
jgi:putative pyruvate formate lyase activating enzyme